LDFRKEQRKGPSKYFPQFSVSVAGLHLAQGQHSEPAAVPLGREADLLEHTDAAGLADRVLDRIERTTSVDGMGLGLSGARRLLDEFTATTTPGEGTTITAINGCQAHEGDEIPRKTRMTPRLSTPRVITANLAAVIPLVMTSLGDDTVKNVHHAVGVR
jgi:hypothetical protein